MDYLIKQIINKLDNLPYDLNSESDKNSIILDKTKHIGNNKKSNCC